MYQNPDLEKIRQRIDTLDNNIHDLLMERAELIDSISEAKRKNNIQIVQPAREARMIRRLLSRHQGILPKKAIVRIWRELVGAITLLQTGLSVSAYVPENNIHFWDLLKNYFGSILPVTRVPAPTHALADVRDEKVTFAALPWPDTQEQNQWWTWLLNESNNGLNIIVALAEDVDTEGTFSSSNAMLIVAKMGFDASEHDNSFICLETSQELSKTLILDNFKAAGMETISIYADASNGSYKYLVEIADYVSIDDERLEEVQKSLSDKGLLRIRHAGGYPIPALLTH